MGLTATFTKFIKKIQKNSLLARDLSSFYKTEKELESEIEVEVLRKLNHPNIIKVEDIIYEKKTGKLNIIMEQGKKNIAEVMEDKKNIGASFDEPTIREFMRQLIEAVGHMHEEGFFHRDLKPENMILVNDQEIRLIDFGTCLQIEKIKDKTVFSDYVSTRWYRAPECILKFPKYDEKVDVFAIGCIMAEFYRMKPAFCGKNALDQLRIYCYALGSPKKSEWPEAFEKAEVLGFEIPALPKRSISYKVDNACMDAIDLMDQMLSMNPEDRPDIRSILQHPYFTENEDLNNPFKSPVRTPDKGENFSKQPFFAGPSSFGTEPIPSFGSIVKDDSPNKVMEAAYSPVNKNDIFASGSHDSHKKVSSELNEGDGLPSDSKFPRSQEKHHGYKKTKSLHEEDHQAVFGGFNISEIKDFKNQKERRKSQMVMDDEITNSDTAIDCFGDKNRKNAEEELPSFGSLVGEVAQIDLSRRKSQYVPKTATFGDLKPQKESCFGKPAEENQEKSESDPINSNAQETSGGAFKDAPAFGSFGFSNLNMSDPQSMPKTVKPKKQSICADDELFFAMPNPDNDQ